MSAPVWKAEITFGSPTAVPSPAPSGMGGAVGTAAGVVLMAADRLGNFWALSGAVNLNVFGAGPTIEWQASYGARYRLTTVPGSNDPPDPFQWRTYDGTFGTNGFVPTGITEANGNNGAGYFGGGTLSITKDFANNQVIFSTPLGTITRTLSESNGGIANLDAIMFPIGHGHFISATNNAVDASESSLLTDFYLSKNGARVYGHSLTPADPGTWDIWQMAPVTIVPDGSSQQPAGYQQMLTLLAGQIPNQQDDWRVTFELPVIDRATDMDKAKEHGVLWRVAPDPTLATDVIIDRSFNSGRNWERFVVYSNMSASNSSPSVNWFAQKIYVTWHDGSNIRQAVSVDGGQTFTVPLTFPYAGTNPRHIIDKEGGAGLYFFFSGNDLMVARSFDGGLTFLDGLPLTIVVGAGAQQIDAEFAADGSVVLSLFIAAVWTKYRSRDFGATWS